MSMRLTNPQVNGMSFNQSGGNQGGGQLRLAGSQESDDDELRKRMELARQQGWKEEDIQRSAMVQRQLQQYNRQQQQAQSQQQTTTQPKKKTGRGGFLTSLISEGGATGGAIGGAAAGTAILPGIGTVIGGALGGLLGGFGGSAVEQKVRDDNVDWGKAGVEGLFSAVPGGTGKVVKTVGKSTASRVGKDELANLFKPQSGVISDAVSNVGNAARARGRGVVTGSSVQGTSNRLMPNESNEINQFLDSIGAKGSVNKQLVKVEKTQAQAGKQIGQIVNDNAFPVSVDDLFKSGARIQKKVIGSNGSGAGKFDPSNSTHKALYNNYARQMSEIKDSSGWLNFKKTLDQDVNYSRNPQSPDPVGEQVATAFRQEAKKQLENLHPDIKTPNKIYGQAENAKNALVRQANPSGVKPFGTSVNGQGIGGKTAQRVMSSAGTTVQRGASLASVPAVNQFGGQVATSTVANSFRPDAQAAEIPSDPSQLFSDPQAQQQQTGPMTFEDMAASMYGEQPQNQSGASSSGLQYSSTELLAAGQQALAVGDYNAYKQYAAAAADAAEIEKQMASSSGGGGPNVTKPTSEKYSAAVTGMQSLQELEQLISSNPGVLNASRMPGRSIETLGIGSDIRNKTGTGQYDNLAFDAVDKMLRIQTGAAAPESEIRRYMSQYVPQAGDDQATIQSKFARLRNTYNSILQLAGQTSTTTSFEDQMTQMMASGQYATGY